MTEQHLTNFTAEDFEEFLASPEKSKSKSKSESESEPATGASGPTGETGSDAEKPPVKKAASKKTDPAPVESQGEAPAPTMKQT